MFELYKTPLDILYLVLSMGISLVVVFLMLALFHLIGILSNIKKVTSKARDTIDLVNHYMWQPIKIMLMIIEKGKEMVANKAKKEKKE